MLFKCPDILLLLAVDITLKTLLYRCKNMGEIY